MKISFNSLKRAVTTIKSHIGAQSVKSGIFPGVSKTRKEKELFCHQYWCKLAEEGRVQQSAYKESVSLHSDLNGINHHFILSPYPEQMNEVFNGRFRLTPREMITKTDIEFKNLKPISEQITTYRCIGEKPEFFSEYPLYKKRLAVKKGDIIDMKEYAYTSPEAEFSKNWLPNGKGILYEIEIPAGARVSVSGNEIVTPRSSKFLCLDTKRIKHDNEDYLKVKLRYLKPDEQWKKTT